MTTNRLAKSNVPERVIAPSDEQERTRFWIERGNRILWGQEPTSKGEWLAMKGLALVGLATSMDTIVGADSSLRHKPDPEPVRVALRRLGSDPEHALYVGDSVHDLMAGRAAGVRTAAALWGAFKREDMEPGCPDFWLESIADLPAVVQTL